LSELVSNKALVIPICAWALAQLLKVLVGLLRERQLDLRYLVSSGGMPSSHTTIVTAMATVVAMLHGVKSTYFALAVIFAVVVMYDAAGVRQAVGAQATLLNNIVEELFKGHKLNEQRLRELIGHTQPQVIAGAALGTLFSWLWITMAS
jgi:hypothetical protein